jgi:two-component system, OmpR family, KDP operon response regulator KdpE
VRLPRILVVDDEPQIQRFLKPALAASDFEVLTAATAREALRLALARGPDLVILDLGLPDADGKSVISQLRQFSAVPIIVLSARGQEDEKIAALDLGADDYVEKPFGIGELLARVRRALRHRPTEENIPDAGLDIGPLHIERGRRLVSRNGAAVHLTPKEFDVLVMLADHRGRVLTHRQLLTAVWGPAHADDVQYLRVVISQLRGKIEADPASPQLILNEPAVGYRLAEA